MRLIWQRTWDSPWATPISRLSVNGPKVGPHSERMRQALAEIMGVGMDQVSVKATTSEKLGFTGREEGIAAQASVLLVPA